VDSLSFADAPPRLKASLALLKPLSLAKLGRVADSPSGNLRETAGDTEAAFVASRPTAALSMPEDQPSERYIGLAWVMAYQCFVVRKLSKTANVSGLT
jgi:hypothetical protein